MDLNNYYQKYEGDGFGLVDRFEYRNPESRGAPSMTLSWPCDLPDYIRALLQIERTKLEWYAMILGFETGTLRPVSPEALPHYRKSPRSYPTTP